MAEKKRKSKLGGVKTEVFAMRLDPKLKYLAEIGARSQRRSLANFVEWAIEKALMEVFLAEPDTRGNGPTVFSASATLWALDEADRLQNLVTHFPDLLTYDEQLIWRVICEHTVYSRDSQTTCSFKNGDTVDMGLVRQCWSEIKGYALEGQTAERLNTVLSDNYQVPF